MMQKSLNTGVPWFLAVPIILTTAKLLGFTWIKDWPWWLVTISLWGPLVLGMTIMIVSAIAGFIAGAVAEIVRTAKGRHNIEGSAMGPEEGERLVREARSGLQRHRVSADEAQRIKQKVRRPDDV